MISEMYTGILIKPMKELRKFTHNEMATIELFVSYGEEFRYFSPCCILI